MIPKNIFLIWFGEKPNFIDFVIDCHKKINYNFDIKFINYNIDKIISIYECANCNINRIDKILKKSISFILNKNKYNKFIDNLIFFYKENLRFIQLLNDIFRFELLNEFGGIYVDCDVLPLKNFLPLTYVSSFIVLKHFENNLIGEDNYFFGTMPNNNIQNYNDFRLKLLQTYINWFKDTKFIERKNNFYNLKSINYDNKFHFFIEHYNYKLWKTEIPLISLDKLI